MARFQRILVATDFSQDCAAAFAEAASMAREWGARLIVLHAYQAPAGAAVSGLPAGDYYETLAAVRTVGEKRLKDLVSGELTKGVDVRPLAVQGSPAETIVETAARERADLIVMGTHGRRGMARLLLGSVAATVIATAECPVLTLRSAGRRARMEAPAA
jgi:nucleotide-binding universal stress UspA family protein